VSVIVTAACPAGLIDDANHLSMTLGRSKHDALTYGAPSWQDDAGNLYACACALVPDGWVSMAQSRLARPAWDTGQRVDLVAAGRAQAAVSIGVAATPGVLAVIIGQRGRDAIAALGVRPVPE
jgi:hypothetical protein